MVILSPNSPLPPSGNTQGTSIATAAWSPLSSCTLWTGGCRTGCCRNIQELGERTLAPCLFLGSNMKRKRKECAAWQRFRLPPYHPQAREQQPEGSFLLPCGRRRADRCGALSSLPLHCHRHPAGGHGLKSPCMSSMYSLSLQSRAMSELAHKQGWKLSSPGSSGPREAQAPAEDKPEHCHCSSTVLLSVAMQSEPHEFCLSRFLQLTISSLVHSQTEL